MRMIRSALALATLLGASLAIHAAGLGKLSVNSALGQILNAEIDLVAVQPGEADSLNARVAPPEAFREARIEYVPALRLLRFTADKRPNGQPYLKVTSIAPINEPFLDVLVEVSWPAGRLQREYPILLDPPGYAQSRITAPSVAAAAPAPAPEPAPKTDEKPAEGAPASAAPSSAATEPAAAEPAATGTPSAREELQAGSSGAAPAAADTYGPVESGENLSKIAGQVKPTDVSLEQMLVALYRENQAAFSGKNMNRLKTGQILRVPTADEVSQITQADARREIHTQVADWNAYREQLASGVSAMPASGAGSAANVASGRVTSAAVTPPPTPAAEPTDTLRISKSAGAGKTGSAGAALQDRVNSLQEEVTAKDQALKEAQSRVADLEKQIQDMQRLLALKGGSAAAKPDAKVGVVPTPATKPAEAPKVAEATPAAPAPAESKPAEAPKPPAEAVASAPKPQPPKAVQPPKRPAPAKAPPPPKGFMDQLLDNPAYLAAGVGGIALLGIAGFVFVRRRRSEGDSGPSSAMTSAFPSDLKPGASTGKPAAGLVDTGNSSFLTDFDKTGPGTIDTDEVDPVAEAEVYIAYGRDAQAEEILKEAMARDRNRHEIALKLLEIYHARKSATAFETVAKELRAAVGEESPLWQKAAAMGAQIDPTNPLYGAAAAGTSTFTAMSPPAAPAAPPKPDLDFDLDTSSSASGQAPAPSFDLDLDARKAGSAAPAQASGVDFDLAPSGASASHMDVQVETPKEEKPAFDFDLSGLDSASSKTAEPARAPAPAAGGSSFDLADLSLEAPAHESGGEAVGTKLELAKAYLEIGDKDGAREILQEVAKEGSSAQKDEAKKLIASL